MNQSLFSHKVLLILAFLAIYFVWGTTYLGIVIGLRGFPPFLMASIRFTIAGFLLVGYCLLRGEPLPDRRSLIKNAVIALVVLAGGQGLLIWSEQHIASGYASVLVATLPLWFVLLDRAHWQLYFRNPLIVLGLLIGFGGIVLLFFDKLQEPLPAENVRLQLIATGAVLFGAVCWVLGTLYNRSRPARGSMYANLGWQLLCGAVICWVIGLAMGEWPRFQPAEAGVSAWAAVIYLAIAGSILAFIAYTWLLSILPSAIVGTYAYINPIVAVSLGWLFADEVITSLQFVGMAIIIVAAILVNVSRARIKKES